VILPIAARSLDHSALNRFDTAVKR